MPIDSKNPTPGFIKKPTPTPELLEAKQTHPPGFCAQVAEQKVRIAKNKQARADFGRQGPSGRGEVSKLMKSPEMLFALALISVVMASFGNVARSVGASLFSGLFGLFSAMPSPVAGPASATGATVAGTRGAERNATPDRSRKHKPKPGLGGGSEGGGTAPRSAARPDIAPPAPETIEQARRRVSLERGDAIRNEAHRLYGDRDVFDLVTAFLTWKVSGRDDPREKAGALDRIRKLNPTVADYLKESHAGSAEFREWRERITVLGAKTAGISNRADQADIGFQVYPKLADRAEAWRKEQPVPQAGEPQPEAGNQGVNAANPNAARPGIDDQDPTYTPPIPGTK